MSRIKEAALIGAMVEALNDRYSFCGETHIQKATYFLTELFDIPLPHQFELYLYGPYSFDLHADLNAMCADDFVRLVPRRLGASWIPGERYPMLRRHFRKTVESFTPQIEFVADRVARFDVKKLEAHATALLVARRDPDTSADARAAALRKIKPHVDPKNAREAVETVDIWAREAAHITA